jgi:transcriptional regulator with XRE-family HTH domain
MHVSFAVVVGQILVQQRSLRGESQLTLAQKLKCGQSKLSRIERGQLPITLEGLAELARAFELTPSELLLKAECAIESLRARGVATHYSRPTKGDLVAQQVGAWLQL